MIASIPQQRLSTYCYVRRIWHTDIGITVPVIPIAVIVISTPSQNVQFSINANNLFCSSEHLCSAASQKHLSSQALDRDFSAAGGTYQAFSHGDHPHDLCANCYLRGVAAPPPLPFFTIVILTDSFTPFAVFLFYYLAPKTATLATDQYDPLKLFPDTLLLITSAPLLGIVTPHALRSPLGSALLHIPITNIGVPATVALMRVFVFVDATFW